MTPVDRYTRRDVLVGAGGALALAATAPFTARASVRVPGIALYDPRSESSQRFAAALARAGSVPIALEADPVRQWYAGLREAMQRQGSVAALTDWSRYLVLRGLAGELRLHPRFEARHRFGRDGTEHRLPATVVASAGDALGAHGLSGPQWPETIARLLLEGAGGKRSGEAVVHASTLPGTSGTFFSWMIG
ncbi:MAG: hypothetical protein DIU56_011800 [Pseudomonadota bacterium]|jgi:hypothetical protein